MTFRVINASNGRILADRAQEATSFFDRFRGLMGRGSFQSGEGLLLVPCNAIHTFFLKVAIDAAFLNAENRVIRAVAVLRPWRATRVTLGAKSVLELPAGTLADTLTSQGDELTFELC
jgi:uncharacterized membrane protein (UPF0127 family)